MLFNNLGFAHKGLPVFMLLLDMFAGIVAQLVAMCGLPGHACGYTPLHQPLDTFFFLFSWSIASMNVESFLPQITCFVVCYFPLLSL